ncbi:MAG: hypothetical protein HY081_03545 [Gammaproteobacteria bacterium]|nr:hypothetical protein [Gammaproteobacteria bacterium]
MATRWPKKTTATPSPDAHRMSIAELMRAIAAAIQAEGPAARYAQLALNTEALADMVSWANGAIDPETKLDDHLNTLQQQLHQLHDQAPDSALASLHDALGDLRNAIMRHDRDLKITGADDEDENN